MTPAHNLVVSVAEKITLPEIYHHINSLVMTPEARIDDFVNVINRDNALAARFIRIANSCFFGYSRKSNTVDQAISMIGIIQVHDLLLSSLAIRTFLGIPGVVVNQEVFWRRSIYCGIVARLLARECMILGSERLFTSGLLHEIGHLVMYANNPELAQGALLDLKQNNQPQYLLEREKLGYDYGQVGCEIMRLWQLSDRYCDIATYHMEPEKAQNNNLEIHFVNLARSIMLAEELNPGQALDPSFNDSNDLINNKLTIQDIEKIKTNALLYVDDVMDCLWPFSRCAA